MTIRRQLLTFMAVAALVSSAWPVDAEQRAGRGSSPRARTPRDAQRGPAVRSPWDQGRWRPFGPWMGQGMMGPYTWPGPGVVGPWGPGGFHVGPIFDGARGWQPYRSYRIGQRFGFPYYHFQHGAMVAPGLWSGVPVPYPSSMMADPLMSGDPSLWMTPHPYYPPPAMWAVPSPVVPPPANAGTPDLALAPADAVPADHPGGLSFQLTPADAEVWIDEAFAGRADQFGPDQEPLPLMPGAHRLELRAAGFEPVIVDVQVPPGQVLPYRGILRRLP